MMIIKKQYLMTLIGSLLLLSNSCGGGIPIQLRIDEFTIDVDTAEWLSLAETQLKASGILQENTLGIPAKWPSSLPEIKYNIPIISPAIPIDLTPAPADQDAETYEQINQAGQLIRRIEINELIVRIERSNLTLAIPQLELQISDKMDSHFLNRKAWVTIGTLEGADPGYVGDLKFEFVRGGESALNAQLLEKEREFALRIKGNLQIDTAENPDLPRGEARFRFIGTFTFFVAPEGIL